MPTKAVTDASFAEDVLASDKPVLVDFWADWCGPCKMIAPALEEISDELADQVSIVKIDIMENTKVPGDIGVQSIPLLCCSRTASRLRKSWAQRPRASSRAGWKAYCNRL